MGPRTLWRRIEHLILGRSAYKFLLDDWTRVPDLDGLAEALASTRYMRTLRPAALNGPRANRILIIAPHEDDEMIGPGGTILKALDAGATVHVVYLAAERGPRGDARRAETAQVSALVGYTTEFLEFPADALPITAKSGALLAQAIRKFNPGAALVPFLTDDHPDHRGASMLLLRAAESGLDGNIEVWAYQVYSAVLPNVVVDITDVSARKTAAIRMWEKSAMQSRDWAHFASGLNAYNSRLLPGNAGARFAEVFFVVPLSEYLAVCRTYASRAAN